MSNGFHHLHTRKRIYKKLEKYPSPNLFKRGLDYLMYGVAIGAPLTLLPQVYQLYAFKEAAGLSLLTWLLLACINVLWCAYASVHKEWLIFTANLLMGCLNFVVMYGIFLYR